MPAPYINWLASYPKSGNTWVRAFLEHYTTGRLNINNMPTVMGDERLYYYQNVTAQPVHTFDIYQWALIRPAALNLYLHMNQDRDRVIIKTHNAFAVVADIPLFPPLLHGPSVYMVRDPVELIPSFAKHTGNSIDDMIKNMSDPSHAFEADVDKRTMIGFLSSWDNHVGTWSGAPNVLVVRYEDLLADPVSWFTEILKHYNYPVDEGMVIASVHATSLEKLQKQEIDSGFREAGKNDIFFGGTKEIMTTEQINDVIQAFGPTMAKFGYLTEDLKYGGYH